MSFFKSEKMLKIKKDICISNITDEFFCFLINDIFKKRPTNYIIVCSSLYEASKLYNIFNTFDEDVLFFPMDDYLTSYSLAASPELRINRLETIKNINKNKKRILITNLEGYVKPLATKKNYEELVLNLKLGLSIEREELLNKLSDLGYQRETYVTKTGEIAVRGYVIDIFPIDEEKPFRLEFFGDEIESIRIFDEVEQKTIKKVESIKIYPTNDLKVTADLSTISDYFDEKTTIFKDYNFIELANKRLEEEVFNFKQSNLESNIEIANFHQIRSDQIIYYDSINNYNKRKNVEEFLFDLKTAPLFNENVSEMLEYFNLQLAKNKTIVLCLSEAQIKTISKKITYNFVKADIDNIKKNKVNLLPVALKQGFIYEDLIVLSEKEIFKQSLKSQVKYKTKFKYSVKINSLDNLEIGDYVVHNSHGIGIYNGINTLKKKDVVKDYIEVLYKAGDKLYIPVEKIDLLSKFAPREGFVAKINSLSGTEWAKTKQKIRSKVQSIAKDLVKLYAKRAEAKGFAFSADGQWQKDFEAEFIYEATEDQKLATKQIKEDMENESPMDRLLCGDVGYGKTEVAFRAIFKAIYDGKQVMYLCPTTILSKQQYQSALDRFRNYPINLALLNRFTSAKESAKILDDFSNKKIDLLFGTHRLLSKDVKANDLGLLIIDEEQRFGVTHKEKIKTIKENIDVLTLSATPIPRTLQMSLMGVRSLSLIETAPVNRYPVQTYVIEESEELLRTAIYKELSRQGQVFVLYNKVEDIERKQEEIQKLVPEAKIINAHGQLNKNDLEARMQSFVDGQYDVLLCTTIIETGIDIPNVNTLIILNSDKFGLSQLYQIRGRVGRTNKVAYAYLTYNPQKTLTEQAIKRLSVIKEFTELGSGFKIANRDLAIRGAGDVLGKEQAGFIDTVGIDLYLKILDEEIKRKQGIDVVEDEEELENPYLELTTHIKDEYVQEDELKIEIHKLINKIDSKDKLLEVKTEIEDRFGKIDADLDVYLQQKLFENIAKKLKIYKVKEHRNNIEIILDKESSQRIDSKSLFETVYQLDKNFRLKFSYNRIAIILETHDLEKHYIYYLVELMLNLSVLLD